MHKKTKSSISLKSLVGGDKDKDNKPSVQDPPQEPKPKKTKSSTNLAALLSRPKSSKSQKSEVSRVTKDKENQTPPSSAGSEPPPIWAQYASQPVQETSNATRVRLNDRMSVDEEVALYTPKDYPPSKQRNFCDYQQPTLAKRPEPKARPKSAYLASTPSLAALADTLSGRRKVSIDRSNHHAPRKDLAPTHRISLEDQRRGSSDREYSSRRSGGEGRKVSSELIKDGVTLAKRGVRVMAAVAALNGKSKEQEKEVKGDVKTIDNAFEALLVSPAWVDRVIEVYTDRGWQDSRNVPPTMREKMRSLDTNIKADFIKQNRGESSSGSKAVASSSCAPWSAVPSSRPVVQSRSQSNVGGSEIPSVNSDSASPTKSRARSKTFTLSKGSESPSKKQKSNANGTHGRVKSIDYTQSGPTKSLASLGAAHGTAFLAAASKQAVPEEFISYLRRTQKPEELEVGKLHKLRLLLRNETVAWVDSFITSGGMGEVVALLHRIIAVEWRFVYPKTHNPTDIQC